METPMAGDTPEFRDGKWYIEGNEVTEQEARAAGWTPEPERMSDEELAKGYAEIEDVAQAIFTATSDTAITVGDGHWDDLDPDAQRDLCKLAAAAIDRRDQQLRERNESPTRVLICEAPDAATLDHRAVMGDASLLADADYVFAFRADTVKVVKARDHAPEDVHVAIQRRAS